jgi:hypothetical protein
MEIVSIQVLSEILMNGGVVRQQVASEGVCE